MSKMVIRYFLFLFILFLSNFSFAEYEIEDNNIYFGNKQIKTELINESLGSLVSFNDNYFKISNHYDASLHTKTEVTYTFNKKNGKLSNIYKINYSPEYDIYYGYELVFNEGNNIEKVDFNYVNDWDVKFGVIDYNFTKLNENLNIKLVTNAGGIDFLTRNKGVAYILKNKIDGEDVLNSNYFECNISDFEVTQNSCKKIGFVNEKSYLYDSPFVSDNKKNIYLVKGDKVVLLKEQKDNKGRAWYFINYKGKKDINMWIKAEAVDLK
ncbi:hypothetical protein NYR82_04630 [Actinobacillus equuli subsp. haemolyticus]|uniref:hypothetical protein n=2 Tax=Actinobacillus equuli TaxID=718 RepID=UPI00244142C4|nr:hypothetical protein [Actinobacillus equuli]WGE78123.1 hypothetical protein NYR82_04630 [Actinobacillus equuli subsp. haemolyticus]